MKNFLIAIIFIGVAAYIGLSLYNSWVEGDWTESGAEPEISTEEIKAPVKKTDTNPYPVNLEVESLDGRKISISLTGRNASHIQFKRATDGEVFVYPIEKLVNKSRELIEKFPANGLSQTKTADTTVGDAYVKELKIAIERIENKLKQLKVDYNATYSKTERRTLERKAEELQLERNTLIGKVRERESASLMKN